MNDKLIRPVINIARLAGKEIMSVYASDDFETLIKEDNSPLTKADLAANNVIVAGLATLDPKLPSVTEESTEDENKEALSSDSHWMIDPLDGTKEFIKRNGEFTVNIALIKNKKPIFGVVYIPVQDVMYWGGESIGAWKQKGENKPESIHVAEMSEPVRIVASRSHVDIQTQTFISQFKNHTLVNSGSSIKICMIADGQAHVYPRFRPLNQWDIAAGDAILRAAGGAIFDPETEEPIIYGSTLLVEKSLSKSLKT